mmetsp:Transcript_26972/g.45223  ORF Transcript_26972/g.45223 Transcript_26972/m.45223 type:complete len:702 (+) Transcript_26972:87-2192(+)|eukprot:CAMPEP_0184658008 /NCGR_PEP_ID=MMETSP0308-20130426/23295_1 /TAXON_ID=38269 /ORGANISM="Gloeochaete witrockiana, Strain SAG 46.84" /LENGTH=701 /DNA_ID=CAMNT_0027096581 /DNA_START=37 /DNA_END=2142 /DNA_ORIENTATION=+
MFDSTAANYAQITADNRVRVWDVASGAVRGDYGEAEDASNIFTCLTWSRPGPFVKIASEAGAKKSAAQPKHLAVGASDGSVIIWDLKRGSVLHRLDRQSGHLSRVNDIVFGSNGDILFSCADDKEVLTWDVAKGSVINRFKAAKQRPSRLALRAVGNDTELIVATSTMKLWDLTSKKAMAKFSGHGGPVSSLRCSGDGKLCISACVNDERFINLWHIDDNSIKSDQSSIPDVYPVQAIALDSPAVFVDCSPSQSPPNSSAQITTYDFLALSQSGVLSIFRYSITPETSSKASSKTASQLTGCTVKCVDRSSPSVPSNPNTQGIFAAAFCWRDAASSDASSYAVMIARGSRLKPIFERVLYVDATTGLLKKSTELSEESPTRGGLLLPEQGSKKKILKQAESQVVAPNSARPVASRQDDVPELADTSGKKKRKSTGDSAGNGPSEIVSSMTEKADGKKEEDYRALEERVMSMNIGNGATTSTGVHSTGTPHASTNETQVNGSTKNVGKNPRADSLQTLLSQALQSNDTTLLEECLAVENPKIIFNTVMRLPTMYVLPLVRSLLHRFETRPGRAPSLVTWLRAVLQQHTSYIMTIPDLVTQTSSLYQTVEARVTVFKSLMKLSGRLDMLLAQVSSRSQQLSSTEQAKPFMVYEQGDQEEDSDEEEEDLEMDETSDVDHASGEEEDEVNTDDANEEESEEDDSS